jgi:hypothetical protein
LTRRNDAPETIAPDGASSRPVSSHEARGPGSAILHSIRSHPVLYTGLATFFFGFGAGALLNFYLILTDSSLLSGLRGSLNYISSIIGDGILLPVVNMIVVSFLRKNRAFISRASVAVALTLGLLITMYFHVAQAVQGLTNWAMPSPWHWNLLGVWHAVYMMSVSSLLCLFFVTVFTSRRRGHVPREALLVTGGIVLFFFLLRLDYSTVDLQSLVPGKS